MREHRLTVPELALFAGTRAMIGLGVGLLISDRLDRDQRRAVGLALLVTGALSTIPLALLIFRGSRGNARSRDASLHREAATMMAD